jgi:site-specific DNA-cytosine methylase
MGMRVDQGNQRLEIKDVTAGREKTRGIAIDLERPGVFRRRMETKPLEVPELASGPSAAYPILRELGWHIEKRVACEIDSETRIVAQGVNPTNTPTKCHDILELAKMDLRGEYDLVLSATPCKGFSGINNKAKGMNGKDGELIRAAAKIIEKVRARNPQVKILMENVVLNENLRDQQEEMNELIGITFKGIKASDQGASQQRERMVATNITDIDMLEKKDAIDPNLLLGRMAEAKHRMTPCLMAAGSATKATVRVRDAPGMRFRDANNDEKDALQGYPVGSSEGFRGDIAEMTRTKVIGNIWNYHQMSAIFRKMRVKQNEGQVSIHMAGIEELQDLSQEERELLKMSSKDRIKLFKKRMEGYKLPELHVTLKEQETFPYQVPKHVRINTPAARKPAALAELKLRMKRGHLKLVKYEQKQWVASMFCKGKDRINPETMLEAIRLLTDFRNLNAAIDWPKHWNELCPTIAGVAESIPRSATHFASEDVSDAYEGARVAEDC